MQNMLLIQYKMHCSTHEYYTEVIHITCNMCSRDLPMYALRPWAYISGKSLVPMLQLLYVTLWWADQRPLQGNKYYILYCPATRAISRYCPGTSFRWTALWFVVWCIRNFQFNKLYNKACNFYLWYRVFYSNNDSKCYYITCCWYRSPL